MKLNVGRIGAKDTSLEGAEARAKLKEVMASIAGNNGGLLAEIWDDLDDEMKAEAINQRRLVRRRVLDTLRSGRPVWDKPDRNGQVSKDSTVVSIPLKIIGIIKADGTWDGEGPDPRLGKGDDEGKT